MGPKIIRNENISYAQLKERVDSVRDKETGLSRVLVRGCTIYNTPQFTDVRQIAVDLGVTDSVMRNCKFIGTTHSWDF